MNSLEDKQKALTGHKGTGRMNMSAVGVSFLCWTREASLELFLVLPIH